VHPKPPPAVPIHPSRSAGQEGFTLVETVLVVIVLTIGLTGIANLTSLANRKQREANSNSSAANAIASDIAEIRRINDRYTCGSVTTTTASCTISSSDLSQNGYYPTSTAGQTNFNNRCTYNPSTFDLVTDLATAIPTSSSASSAALTAAGVTRTITTNAQAGMHLYTVSYSYGGSTVRTLSLVPTAAAWCP